MRGENEDGGQWWDIFLTCVEVNADRNKVMVLNGEERLECEVYMTGMIGACMCQNLNAWAVCWMN